MEEKILIIRGLCFVVFVLIALCGVLIGYAYSTNRQNERLRVQDERKTELNIYLNNKAEQSQKDYDELAKDYIRLEQKYKELVNNGKN